MAVAMASTALSIYGENKALEAQGAANAQTAKNYITSMNYSFQNLEQERADAFDATVADLQKIRLQGNRQVKSVEAAVNEGMMGGGRTSDLIKRSAQADVNRAVWSSKDNYARKSNEIDLNKENTLRNTQRQIANIPQVKKPSLLSTLVRFGASYLGARQTEDAINAVRGQAGVTRDSLSVGTQGLSTSSASAMQTSARFTISNNMNMYTNYTDIAVQRALGVDTENILGHYTPFTNPFNKWSQ